MNPSWVVAVIAATLISHAVFAQGCPSSEEEMDDVMSEYNSKVSLIMANHPEQLNLIGIYQNKFFALSNKIDAAYDKQKAARACQIFLNLKTKLDPIERQVCGGSLCVH
jgi:hypothetical protein